MGTRLRVTSPDYAHSLASSVWQDNKIGEDWGQGRLNSPLGWAAGSSNPGNWWQMDLGAEMLVGGVVIQGIMGFPEWFKKYNVEISNDGEDFENYQTFESDTPGDVSVVQLFDLPVCTRYVRI